MDFDVVIIGSGPAGGMAAIQCAEAGLKIALFEKESLPRRKVCAGGVVMRAINLLPNDLDYPIESICNNIELRVLDSGKSFQDYRENLVTMVDRANFDYALVKHAKKKGAQIFDGVEIKSVEPLEDCVHIVAGTQRFSTAYLILAEGASAKITNKFWEDDRVLVPALESEVMLSPEEMKAFEGVARFDYERNNSGYAWVFPKKDHISVGIGSLPGEKLSLNKLFDDYKIKIGLTSQHIERNRRGFVIPIRPRKPPYMKQRMILVGDAAGFADPISAEGFTYALKSGLEAGKAVAMGANPDEVSRLYHKGIDQTVVKELGVGRMLAVPFFISKRLRNFLLNRYGSRLVKGMVRVCEGAQSYMDVLLRRPLISFFVLRKSKHK